jgi:hypothetical protein
MHRGTNLHNKINFCPVPMREDLETKIPEKTTLMHGSMGGNLRSMCSSRNMPLLTKVAIESCHVD